MSNITWNFGPAIYVRAPYDKNGNPRRGWIVYHTDGNFFIEEEYNGRNYLTKVYPAAVVISEINVSIKEFNSIKKQCKVAK